MSQKDNNKNAAKLSNQAEILIGYKNMSLGKKIDLLI